MKKESTREVPFMLKMLTACIAMQTVVITYTIAEAAEHRGTTVVVSTSRDSGPERGASCPQPRNPLVRLDLNPEPLNEKVT